MINNIKTNCSWHFVNIWMINLIHKSDWWRFKRIMFWQMDSNFPHTILVWRIFRSIKFDTKFVEATEYCDLNFIKNINAIIMMPFSMNKIVVFYYLMFRFNELYQVRVNTSFSLNWTTHVLGAFNWNKFCRWNEAAQKLLLFF